MIKKLIWFLKNLDIFISGLALAAIVLLTFAGVFMRYVVGKPFSWLEEVQKMLIVWSVFFAAGAAFRTKNHVAIDMVVTHFPDTLRYIAETIVYLAVMATFVYLFIRSGGMVVQLAGTGRVTNILRIPYKYIYLALPIGAVLMAVSYTIQSIEEGYIFGIRSRREAGGEENGE